MASGSKRRWFITGVSGGLGRALAEAALARGDSVAGTVRRTSDADAFAALAPGRAHPIQLDVTDAPRIPAAVEEAIAVLGSVDVLVNNAGRGAVGALEELSDAEIRSIFEVNVFGTLNVIRAMLPHLRAQGGHIVNISSAGGQMGFPGISAYCGSKFAIGGISEALAGELAPFGIGVTLVEPGAFRTAFSGGAVLLPAEPLSAYDDTPAGQARGFPAQLSGREVGDPAKAAAAILAALDAPEPPERLVLGSDGLATVRGKIARLARQLDAWEELSRSTDFTGERPFDFSRGQSARKRG